MAIKVRKVAEIIANHVIVSDARFGGEIAGFLFSFRPEFDASSECSWEIDVVIGKGNEARKITLDAPPFTGSSQSADTPTLIGEDKVGRCFFIFKNCIFISDRPARSDDENTEITLRMKKALYDEETEISTLRAAVANLEAAIEYRKLGPRRDPIPDDVKLLVWARDGGACVHCGATDGLHFDHIIPVALGGGNTEANIQILCQACNLRKSDKIGIP
jgi:hypothetical protein